MFDKWIKVDDFNNEWLKKRTTSRYNKQKAINHILSRAYFDDKKAYEEEQTIENKLREEEEIHKSLMQTYDQLASILTKALDEKIPLFMDVTPCEKWRYDYLLEYFSISYLSKHIFLKVGFANRYFELNLSEISNIQLKKYDDDIICEIWSKSCFYKKISIEIPYLELPKPITENTSYYEREPKEYEKYKDKDNYLYHIGFVKDFYGTPLDEADYINKLGGKYHLFCYKNHVIYSDESERDREVIYFEIRRDMSMEIVEFILPAELQNIGVGTVILNMVLNYAKNLGVTKITGRLSSVDDHNKDRRDHVYRKAGFEVTSKSICLKLNSKNQEE